MQNLKNVPLTELKLSPLAFTLSIKAPAIEKVLIKNSVSLSDQILYTGIIGGAALGSGLSGFAAVGLPQLLAVPASIGLCYIVGKLAYRYFQGSFVDARLADSRAMLNAVLDAEDAELLAHITAGVVTSQYGNRKWLQPLNQLRESGACDSYQYLATVFTKEPDCWRQCTSRVYSLHAEQAGALIKARAAAEMGMAHAH